MKIFKIAFTFFIMLFATPMWGSELYYYYPDSNTGFYLGVHDGEVVISRSARDSDSDWSVEFDEEEGAYAIKNMNSDLFLAATNNGLVTLVPTYGPQAEWEIFDDGLQTFIRAAEAQDDGGYLQIAGERLVLASASTLNEGWQIFASYFAKKGYAPLITHPESVSDEYLIALKPWAWQADLVATVEDAGGKVLANFSKLDVVHALLDAEGLAAIRALPTVAYIEENGPVYPSAVASWGLDRIDQINLPLNGAYKPIGDGSGAHAYIIDSGILATHNEFEGRTGNGETFVSDGGPYDDCLSHGTHVAGTVGGKTVGVAKKVTLHSARVFGCKSSGTLSAVLGAIEWIITNHIKPAVANLSLQAGASAVVDEAVSRAVQNGITMVVAAGNANSDACYYSPSRAPLALTIGATTSDDQRSSFSNWGTCVDIFAPGSSINSAMPWSNTSFGLKSGTSMATPHVVGAAAIYLGKFPKATPAQTTGYLVASANKDHVIDPQGSPNLLLFMGEVPNIPPVANAGSDTVVQEGVAFTLDGSKSTDADGQIVAFEWQQKSGPFPAVLATPAAAKTKVQGLTKGLAPYVFTLQVTDNLGASATDEIAIDVNQAPLVNAGPDFTGNSPRISLKGTASDLDGTITSVLWTKIKGGRAIFSNRRQLATQVGRLVKGIYVFKLQVRDDRGGMVSDTVRVTVK